MKRATVTEIENKLIKAGLQPVELAANAQHQSRKFYDPKAKVAYITFKNGHVARTISGATGKRVSLNPVQDKQLVMINTEVARLNRILSYVQPAEK
jgi:uncharacterized protein YuzE